MTVWNLILYFVQAIVILFLYLDEKIDAEEMGQE